MPTRLGPINRPSSIVTSGMVLHFDPANTSSYPGTGTLVTDLSGSGNNGTLGAGVSFSSDNGGVLIFNNSNTARIEVPHSASLDIRRTITLSVWIRLGTSFPTPWTTVVSKMDTAGTSESRTYSIWFNSSRFFHLTSANAAGNLQSVLNTLTPSIYANEWIYFVGTIDRTSGLFKTYLNGVNNTRGPCQVSDSFSSTNPVVLGFRTSASGYSPIDARYGPFMIYNRVLSDNEVATNFEALRGRYGI
jgi:hypothetical protein